MGVLVPYLDDETTTNPPSARRTWRLFKTPERDLAINTALFSTPYGVTVAGVVCARQSVSVSQIANSVDAWHITANYSPKSFPYQFRTTGQQVKIFTSFATQIYPAPDEDGPDFHGGIGWNGSDFDGVDITIPSLSWDETYTVPAAALTTAYMAKLCLLTGKVNAGTFRGFKPWEVLFMGSSGGHQKNETESEITYSFAANPNVQNLKVGPIEGITKKGWQYLWTLNKPRVVDGRKIARPVAAYVETVYPEADFAQLVIE